VVFAGLVLAMVQLRSLAAMLVLAIFLAITMAPICEAIQRRGGPRWVAIGVCALLLFGTVGGFFFFVTPLAAGQMGGLIKMLPSFKEQVVARLPSAGAFRDLVEGVLQSANFNDPAPLMREFFNYAALAVERILQLFVVLILAIYLLVDGRRVYAWLLAFLPERQQARVGKAAPEVEEVIFNYMGGQLITSLLCAVFCFAVLAILGVPNALLLAVMAGIFDILPIIGFLMSLVPAVASALTVSASAAWLVALLFTGYHLLENYYIVPKVYGNRLRLSGLTVLVGCLAAGLLAGPVGIVVVLPLLACYPIIERTWLRPVLVPGTVEEHEKLEAEAETEEEPHRAGAPT